MTSCGATPQEWAHFSGVLGLTADLLPVVSNPKAIISAASNMKTCGKTPSVYNRNRGVVGINGWTTRVSTHNDIAQWLLEPDYGICVQTRLVRALDVDIEDVEEAETVKESLTALGLPMRYRDNSSKFLLVFRLGGEYAKRVLHTKSGIIEFLATGQQFVACGTHPSGARYQWRGGLPKEIPALDEADVLDLLAAV